MLRPIMLNRLSEENLKPLSSDIEGHVSPLHDIRYLRQNFGIQAQEFKFRELPIQFDAPRYKTKFGEKVVWLQDGLVD